MNKHDFQKAWGLVRKFANAHKDLPPVGYAYNGGVGLSAGFAYEADCFINRELSGGRFHLDATDAQCAATSAAIEAFAAREIARLPAPAPAEWDDASAYDHS